MNRKWREKEKITHETFPNDPVVPGSCVCESEVAFNQGSLFFQESGAPAAQSSLSRCWEPHAFHFIPLIKETLQEGKVYFTQMFHLSAIDGPEHSRLSSGLKPTLRYMSSEASVRN